MNIPEYNNAPVRSNRLTHSLRFKCLVPGHHEPNYIGDDVDILLVIGRRLPSSR